MKDVGVDSGGARLSWFCREAVIHFELYRLLKNCLVSGGYSGIDVEPELIVSGRSADLVLSRKVDCENKHILVIEVKSGLRPFSAYDAKAKEQAKDYAALLNANYCAVTNGRIISLLRRKPEKDYGYYYFELTEDFVKRFLNDLFDIIAGRREELSLQRAPSFDDIVKSTNILAESLKEVLESLGGQEGFRLETEDKEKTRMFYLSVGKFRRVFRLGIPHITFPDNTPSVDVRINELKRKLTPETAKELITKLSNISGFEWIKDRDIEKGFFWGYLTPLNQVIMKKFKKELTDWFNELSTWSK